MHKGAGRGGVLSRKSLIDIGTDFKSRWADARADVGQQIRRIVAGISQRLHGVGDHAARQAAPARVRRRNACSAAVGE